MICRKSPLVFNPSFILAALLALASAGIAQTRTAHDESTVSTHPAPMPTTFHFSDGGDDIAGRMTVDAAGNFYISAALNSTPHVSGFAVLKYNFNGKLQRAIRYKLEPGESQHDAKWRR